jgi:eukaryotic translation initiation factor 2C
MGVSYAPPAYYADHLCERGRCYLRNLLNPSLEERSELDRYKAKLVYDRRKFRDSLFGPRKKNDKGMVIITQEERKLRKTHADEVDLELRRYTFKKSDNLFKLGPGDGRGNPWRENIGKTMFWM